MTDQKFFIRGTSENFIADEVSGALYLQFEKIDGFWSVTACSKYNAWILPKVFYPVVFEDKSREEMAASVANWRCLDV